ncbi:cell division protein FtsB [Rossellomorea marisflavi]
MVSQKWYLSTWFISLCFLFSILILPFIAGLILLILQIVDRKSQIEKLKSSGIDKVQDAKMELEKLEAEIGLLKTKRESQISKLQILDDALIIDAKVIALELQKKELESKLKQLSDTIVEKNNQIVQLDDEILYQSFGFLRVKI